MQSALYFQISGTTSPADDAAPGISKRIDKINIILGAIMDIHVYSQTLIGRIKYPFGTATIKELQSNE